jgi:hypothetical protein
MRFSNDSAGTLGLFSRVSGLKTSGKSHFSRLRRDNNEERGYAEKGQGRVNVYGIPLMLGMDCQEKRKTMLRMFP